MLTIESWFDSNEWRINEIDRKRYEQSETIRFNSTELQTLVSTWIRDELGEKVYRTDLVIDLSSKISKKILQLLSEKYQTYKILVQTFLSKESPQRTLFVSYRFDRRTDLCLTINETNGHM